MSIANEGTKRSERYKFPYREKSCPCIYQGMYISVSVWKQKWNNFWFTAWNKLIFRVSSAKKSYCWLSRPAPWAPQAGPWSGKDPFPRTQTSFWVLVLRDHDIPFWKSIDKPNTNFVTDILPKFWGSKMR